MKVYSYLDSRPAAARHPPADPHPGARRRRRPARRARARPPWATPWRACSRIAPCVSVWPPTPGGFAQREFTPEAFRAASFWPSMTPSRTGSGARCRRDGCDDRDDSEAVTAWPGLRPSRRRRDAASGPSAPGPGQAPANDVSLLARALQPRAGRRTSTSPTSATSLSTCCRAGWTSRFAREGLRAAALRRRLRPVRAGGAGGADSASFRVPAGPRPARPLAPPAAAGGLGSPSPRSQPAERQRPARGRRRPRRVLGPLGPASGSPATLLSPTSPCPPSPPSASPTCTPSTARPSFYLELNLGLLRRFKGHPRVQVFDLDRLASRFGKDRRARPQACTTWPRWSGARPSCRCVAGGAGAPRRGPRAAWPASAWCSTSTTPSGAAWWGRTAPAGVKIGPGDPEGEAFLDFQHRLKALQAQRRAARHVQQEQPGDVHELFDSRLGDPARRSPTSPPSRSPGSPSTRA